MKKHFALAAGLAALLSSGAAMAADILGKAEGSVKDYTPARSWTGFYIGVEAGGGAGVFEATRRAARHIDGQTATYTKDDNSISTADGGDANTDPDPVRCCTEAYDDGVLKDGYNVETGVTRIFNDIRQDKLDLGLDGFFGGVNIEYKRQFGSNFVAGVFGSFDWGKMSGSDTFARQISLDGAAIDAIEETTGFGNYALATEAGHVSIERKWAGDAGVKLGYLVTPDTLVYGLVAASFGRFDIKGGSDISLLDGAQSFSPYPASSYSKGETKVGLKLGGGIETRLADRLNLGVEGAWTRYQNLDVGAGGSKFWADPDCPDQGIITSTNEGIGGKLGIFDVKATLKYQLN